MFPPIDSSSSSSDDLSESDILRDDNSTDEEGLSELSNNDDDDHDGVNDVMYSVGDYVLVQFAGKSKIHYYVGVIENTDGDELEGSFMRKGKTDPFLGKPMFFFKFKDECSFPKEDVVRKLPKPTTVGGTARKAKHFVFPCSLDMWHIE